MKIRSALLLGALALQLPLANAQALWAGTAVGMSAEEARKAHPDALPGSGTKSGDGAVQQLKVPLQLGGSQWSAGLYFLDDKLTRVILQPDPDPSPVTVVQTYDRVSESLRAKYGPEVSNNMDRSYPAQPRGRRIWRSGETTITLQVMVIGRDFALLTLHYGPAREGDAGKL